MPTTGDRLVRSAEPLVPEADIAALDGTPAERLRVLVPAVQKIVASLIEAEGTFERLENRDEGAGALAEMWDTLERFARKGRRAAEERKKRHRAGVIDIATARARLRPKA